MHSIYNIIEWELTEVCPRKLDHYWDNHFFIIFTKPLLPICIRIPYRCLHTARSFADVDIFCGGALERVAHR